MQYALIFYDLQLILAPMGNRVANAVIEAQVRT